MEIFLNFKRRIGKVFFLILLMFFLFPGKADAEEKTLNIIVDAGHGGSQSGMEINTEEGTVREKDLNLKIAQYLCEELEKYENVNLCMTRTEDSGVELLRRTEIGKENNGDVLISIHNNAKGDCCMYDHGCTVLVSKGAYKEEMAEFEQNLACNILYELSQLGIEDQGILLRDSENGEVYPNDTVADYYAIVRNGIKEDIPSIIIEHAFMDHAQDYENYLSSEEKLKELAQADARGIARFYQLKRKEDQKILDPLENRKEKLVLVKDGQSENNEISYRLFYEKEEISTTEDEPPKQEEKKESTSEENSSQEISREKEPEQKEKTSFLWIGLFVAGVGVICFCFLVYRKRKR